MIWRRKLKAFRNVTLRKLAMWLGLFLLIDYYLGIVTYVRQIPFDQFDNYPQKVNYKQLVETVLAANGSYDGLPKYLKPSSLFNWSLAQPTSPCTAAGQNLFLLLVVKSVGGNIENRHIIRKAWGRTIEISTGHLGPIQTRTVFIVGIPDRVEQRETVLDEAFLYNDMLIFDFPETVVPQATYKALLGLRFDCHFCNFQKDL